MFDVLSSLGKGLYDTAKLVGSGGGSIIPASSAAVVTGNGVTYGSGPYVPSLTTPRAGTNGGSSAPRYSYGSDGFSFARPAGGAMGFGGSGNSLLAPRIASVTANDSGERYAASAAQAELQRVQEAYNQARQKRYAKLMSLAQQFGKSQTRAINRDTKAALGRVGQSAIDRGLGNTTVLDSLQAGVRRDRREALSDVAEKKARVKADIVAGEMPDRPEWSLYAQMLGRRQ